jgi:hypothetical protein
MVIEFPGNINSGSTEEARNRFNIEGALSVKTMS